MTKYRIVERWYAVGGKHYCVESRLCLFWWQTEKYFDKLSDAKCHIARLIEESKLPHDKVVHEE